MAQDARDAEILAVVFLAGVVAGGRFLPGDLIAGLTLAAIAIPEQMATARLGGFEPQIGFFAFIAGSIGFALLGGNRFLSCGADSTITPIFAGGLAALAATGSPDYSAHAIALALIVGLMLVGSGIFRLGGIANLLSVPVTVGFLAGISVHILVSQLPGVLGNRIADRTDARPHRCDRGTYRPVQPLYDLHRLRRAGGGDRRPRRSAPKFRAR